MKIIALLSLLTIISCGGDFDYGNFPRDKSHYDKIINDKSISESKTFLQTKKVTSNTNPDLKEDIYLENSSFGIKVALYKNGKFYYQLADLGMKGDGYGNWNFRDGIFIIDTNGKRSLFDVILHIFSADPEAKTYKVRFRDRFGWQVLKLNVVNKL